MSNTACLFCDEHRSGENTFLENDLFRARWDQIPVSPGHAEILPKRHIQYFEELTDDELAKLLLFVKQAINVLKQQDIYESEYERLLQSANDFVEPYLKVAFEKSTLLTTAPTAFNHGLNDGTDAGQSVPHFHYHIIPRWEGDVANPKGGIRRMFGEDEYSNG